MSADRYLRFKYKDKDIWPRNWRPLLWPVYVRKVLYLAEHSRRVNLFEQAILGLARAQCRDRFEMAGFLGLDPELVAFIIAQLDGRGWMNASGAVTPEGEKILEEEEDVSEEVCMGYAYQDAISGDWLPRFTGELSELEPERTNERGYPVFLRDRNSGKEDSPFRLKHTRKGERDINALSEALKRYRVDHEHARQREEDGDLPDLIRIENLGFVDDDARPMWLWTWVFPDKAGPQAWLVADPFGLQPAASWLRKPLQEVLPENDALARYIAKMFGDSGPEQQSAAEWLRSLENQVDLELLAEYGWSSKVPLVKGYLASVLRQREALAKQDGSLQEYITSLLVETHNLAESVFKWLLKKYPVELSRLPDKSTDKNWNRNLAADILKTLPVVPLTEDTVRRLSTQNMREIRNALIRGNTSLKALMFAALLSTVEHSKHPLAVISAERLSLDRVLDMTDARNKKAGHATSEKISKDEAMEYANFFVEWVKIFEEWY
jgi:hypothetical protein